METRKISLKKPGQGNGEREYVAAREGIGLNAGFLRIEKTLCRFKC